MPANSDGRASAKAAESTLRIEVRPPAPRTVIDTEAVVSEVGDQGYWSRSRGGRPEAGKEKASR